MELFVLGEKQFQLKKERFKLGEGWLNMGVEVVQFWRGLADLVSDYGLCRGGINQTWERDGSN